MFFFNRVHIVTMESIKYTSDVQTEKVCVHSIETDIFDPSTIAKNTKEKFGRNNTIKTC